MQASTAAPDWGDFTHTLKVKKAEPNSTLTLILFETSMKDGSRRMELIIPLPE
ncbi:Gmad2 immunoglobulin-like domain-containing protein [Brevibacillus brevis]|uniref:Gmad2 immunoglobulin-like domain-containing protein n=1 Tax=Brevibacillus brevis TaxID=1393 RepID=UPI0034646E6C